MNAPNHHTSEIARAFHEFVMNVRWSRPGQSNMMEVLPGFIRLVYQDREPSVVQDPSFLREFVVEEDDNQNQTVPSSSVLFPLPIPHPPTPPPLPFESNGGRLLQTLMELGLPTPPLPRRSRVIIPTFANVLRNNQYDVLRSQSIQENGNGSGGNGNESRVEPTRTVELDHTRTVELHQFGERIERMVSDMLNDAGRPEEIVIDIPLYARVSDEEDENEPSPHNDSSQNDSPDVFQHEDELDALFENAV